MRTKLKGLIREEAGAALVLTLVLLVVGGLILAPLMGHVGTGHLAGQVHEKRMDELYAADAGVEYAIWTITHNGTAPTESLDVNGKAVGVDIDDSQSRRWHITSTAITEGVDGPVSSTTVTADLKSVCFADNAITSKNSVHLGNKAHVEGTIQYGTLLDPHVNAVYDPNKTIHEQYAAWPPSDDLYTYYYSKYVESVHSFVYVQDKTVLEALDYPNNPLHWTGNLDIENSPPDNVSYLQLPGTMYVDGSLEFPQPGHPYTIDLNGHAIFVEGTIDFPSNAVTVKGPGAIIAVGNIWFQPGAAASRDAILLLSLEGSIHFQPDGEFTGFVMSVEKGVTFKPGGDFYGSVAGDVDVQLDSKVRLIWESIYETGIDFPFDDFSMWRLRSYSIHTETG